KESQEGHRSYMVSRTDISHRIAEIRPEAELLLCCARTQLDAERAGRIQALLGTEIDWKYLFKMAGRHRLMPLLQHHLISLAPESIPPEALRSLQVCCHAITVHNLHLTRELLRLLDLFQAASLEALPYKGPALATAVYRDLTLRPFSDLDILVRKKDLARCK